jgi:hypothetical protein
MSSPIADKLDKISGMPSRGAAAEGLLLDLNDRWLKKYEPGCLRAKRVAIFTSMQGAKTLSTEG